MFPIYLVPITIVASLAAIVGLYCRYTAGDRGSGRSLDSLHHR